MDCYRVQLMVHGRSIARRCDSETPLAEITEWMRSESGTVEADADQAAIERDS
jgi:hypothetical protein